MDPSKRLKRWMSLIGLAGLFAGVPIGITLHQLWEAQEVIDSPLLQRFHDRYRLDAKQMHLVRSILLEKGRETLEVYSRKYDRLSPELQKEIEDINRRADERIEVVLDSIQVERYRKDRKADSESK